MSRRSSSCLEGYGWAAAGAALGRLAIILAVIAALTVATTAWPHEWYIGKRNATGQSCCGGSDCAPLPRKAVREVRSGYAVAIWALNGIKAPEDATEIIVPWERVQPTPYDDDTDFHACVWGGELKCFFAPPLGS